MMRKILPLLSMGFILWAFGCATTQSAKIGNTINYNWDQQVVYPRIEETGYYFTFQLDISGYNGRKLPVKIFAQGNYFLGENTAIPPYDDTTWESFRVFVPVSRLATLPSSYGYKVYVLSPDNDDVYIEVAEIAESSIRPPSIIWKWLDYTEDVRLPSGDDGFQLNVRLDLNGLKDKNLGVVLLLRDSEGNEFSASEGGPFQLSAMTLKPGFKNAFYDKLTLNVPYKLLENLGISRTVILTPAIQMDGKIHEGNLYVRFWAGGSLDRQQKLVQDRTERLDEQIRYIERQVEILQSEIAK